MRPPRLFTGVSGRRRVHLNSLLTPARSKRPPPKTGATAAVLRWPFSTGIPPPSFSDQETNHNLLCATNRRLGAPRLPFTRVASESTLLLRSTGLPVDREIHAPRPPPPPDERRGAAAASTCRTVAAICPVTAAATAFTGLATCSLFPDPPTAPTLERKKGKGKEPTAEDQTDAIKWLQSLSPKQQVEIYWYMIDNGLISSQTSPLTDTLTKDKINEFFREADTDNDGDLSKEEFHDWFKEKFPSRHPECPLGDVSPSKMPVAEPTKAQLNAYSLRVALPFFGFGFIDNFLMIVFGESIDIAISQKFGMSMMFSAGLGNVFADSIGIMTGDAVDRIFSRLDQKRRKNTKTSKNDKPLPLTPEQQKLPAVTRRRTVFKIVGIATGCIVGMVPLLVL